MSYCSATTCFITVLQYAEVFFEYKWIFTGSDLTPFLLFYPIIAPVYYYFLLNCRFDLTVSHTMFHAHLQIKRHAVTHYFKRNMILILFKLSKFILLIRVRFCRLDTDGRWLVSKNEENIADHASALHCLIQKKSAFAKVLQSRVSSEVSSLEQRLRRDPLSAPRLR